MTSPSVTIGPFVQGEIPDPFEYQFLDSDGDPQPLTGYVAKFSYREKWGGATLADATVTAPLTGKVTYIWTGDEFSTAGHYLAELWVGDGVNRYASVYVFWETRVAVGVVPSI